MALQKGKNNLYVDIQRVLTFVNNAREQFGFTAIDLNSGQQKLSKVDNLNKLKTGLSQLKSNTHVSNSNVLDNIDDMEIPTVQSLLKYNILEELENYTEALEDVCAFDSGFGGNTSFNGSNNSFGRSSNGSFTRSFSSNNSFSRPTTFSSNNSFGSRNNSFNSGQNGFGFSFQSSVRSGQNSFSFSFSGQSSNNSSHGSNRSVHGGFTGGFRGN